MRVRLVLAGATMALASAVPLVATPGGAGASTSICSIETPAKVGAVLGVAITKGTKDVQGNTTVCWYKVGANTHGAFVRVQTHATAATYQSDLKSAATYGEHPVKDTTFSPLSAFDTTLGSASYGYTYSVTVLKKSTEVAVGATGTSMTKVRGLAKKVLAII